MLGARDPLRHRPNRILIAGVTGSGKSTLARRIAESRKLPYVEIDSLYHGPRWTPRAEFVTEVDAFTTSQSWVTEWQYTAVRAMLAERADTVVWLDYPARVALSRVIRRTIRRSRTREPLWNGNVEGPLRSFFTDPDHIVRWALKTRRAYRVTVPALESSYPQLQIVRLRSQREVENWLVGPFAPS
jgi:adenylate kinase family enzyme